MCKAYVGIDLGTSALKLIAIDADGKLLNSHTETYSLSFPQAGWAEQNPEEWLEALMRGLPILLEKIKGHQLIGIGIAGQMHGLVALDKDDRVIRPAILWNDGRSVREVDYLNNEVGRDKLLEWTGNIAFAGFTAPKILWMLNNESNQFKRISKIMLPKDYLLYRLTGIFAGDVSDASGTLLFDVKNRKWSEPMLDICNIDKSKVPQIYESYEIVGRIREEVAKELGINSNCYLVAGAGDNAAAAIGAAVIGDGQCNISIGTSGTVLVGSSEFRQTRVEAIHNFNHADGTYHYLGCILSAASAFDWWMKDILEADFSKFDALMENKLGENCVFFLPYLMGERSPHNDPNARAAFVGMSRDTSSSDLSLAVLEGVAFALRDSLDSIRDLGIAVTSANLVGGGAKNHLWKRIIANVLNLEILTLSGEEGPAKGAALLALHADQADKDLLTVCKQNIAVDDRIEPEDELVEKYEKQYRKYKKLYPTLRDFYLE